MTVSGHAAEEKHKSDLEQGRTGLSSAIMRWIPIGIIVVVIVGFGIWGWQNWQGDTLANLPVVDAEQEQTASAGEIPESVTINGAAATDATEEPVQSTVEDSETAETVETVDTSVQEASSEPESTASIGSLSVVAVAGTNGTELWSSADGVLLQTVPTGTRLTATARSDDGSWLYVASEDAEGWIETAQVFVFGSDDLPVLDTTTEAALLATESEMGVEDSTEAATISLISMNADSAVLTVADVATDAPAADTASVDTASVDTALADTASADMASVTATVTLSSSRLNVRSGPGTDYSIIAKAYPDEAFTILARDESGEWLQIALPDVEGGFGWVSAEYMATSTAIDTLPISAELSQAPIFESASTLESTATASTDGIAAEESDSAFVLASTDATSGSATGLSGTLAFQSSHGMIYIYDLETAELWPLTAGFDPAISPDGTTVAFTRDGGENGLYLIGIDGSNERLIFSGREQLSSPKWSTDGSEILFSYRTESEATAARFPGGGEAATTTEYAYHLAIVDTNGDNYHDVSALESARAADWNEAGIVYQSASGIQVTTDAYDAENQLVTFDYLNPDYVDPDWQPDGGQIAFMQREGSHWEIYVVNPDGTELTALTQPETALVDVLPSNVAPAYSPDGQYIVYLSNRGEDNSADAWQIWVMEADGSNAHPLDVDVEIEYTFGAEQAVSWGI